MPSSYLILGHPLLLLPPISPSIRVFSNESILRMRCPKYWSFSFIIIPPKEIPGLISFRMDWLDLLAVQGTLRSLLQHHSSKASILWCSAFFTVQLSHPYMTTGKTIALTRRTLVGKVMSLLLNILSRSVITFQEKRQPNSVCPNFCWNCISRLTSHRNLGWFFHLTFICWLPFLSCVGSNIQVSHLLGIPTLYHGCHCVLIFHKLSSKNKPLNNKE